MQLQYRKINLNTVGAIPADTMSHWLSADQTRHYAHLTTPALAQALHSVVVPKPETHRSMELHAAGMFFAAVPAALIVVQRSNKSRLNVLSLAVSAQFRRLGLAKQILQWLKEEASELGCSTLMVSFPLDQPSTSAMKRLTDPALGWQHSSGLRLVHFDRHGMNALLERLSPLSSRWVRSGRFSSVEWQDLQHEQHKELKMLKKISPQWAWPDLSVEHAAVGQRDGASSCVLLDHGAVAGWLTVDRVGVSTMRVTQWWVNPDLQGHGAALMLLQKAVSKALALDPLYLDGTFGVASDNRAMLTLSRRIIEPLAQATKVGERAILSIQK